MSLLRSKNHPKWQNFAVPHFFQWLILDCAQCVYSILHRHLHCTHYILWTPTFLCDNSESLLSWFPPPAQPHPSVAPVPVLYVHSDWGTLPNSLTHRKRWSAGLNFHPSMWTRTQWHFSIRQAGRWSRAWSWRPLCQTLTVTVTLWARRRFYSVPYFLLFNPQVHLLFLSFFPKLEIHLCQFLILPPPKDKSKVGTGGNQERKKEKCQKLILCVQGVKQNTLYLHHLLAVDSACGHDAQCIRCVCMCEAKSDNITASERCWGK